MEIVLVTLALAAGAIYVLTVPAGGLPAGVSPTILRPSMLPGGERPLGTLPPPPLPAVPTIGSRIGSGAGIGTAILPGAGTAIGATIGAIFAFIELGYRGGLESEFAKMLGFDGLWSLVDSLENRIGRADLADIANSLAIAGRTGVSPKPPHDRILGLPIGTVAERNNVWREWEKMVVAAYEQAGYVFPA